MRPWKPKGRSLHWMESFLWNWDFGENRTETALKMTACANDFATFLNEINSRSCDGQRVRKRKDGKDKSEKKFYLMV